MTCIRWSQFRLLPKGPLPESLPDKAWTAIGPISPISPIGPI